MHTMRNMIILGLAIAVIALPFIFRRDGARGYAPPGARTLIVISPHNEAIRQEFAAAFSQWHSEKFGEPVRIDWRVIGGTTEIMRYLEAEFTASFQAWWRLQDESWPAGGGAMITDRRYNPAKPPPENPDERESFKIRKRLYLAFRNTDDADAFGSSIDLFFGGGAYDHGKAAAQGITVVPWAENEVPEELIRTADGEVLIPETLSGEPWRTKKWYGTAASAFGICYNPDRLHDLGIEQTPKRWNDLANPAYAGQLGIADPTKSGSIAKAFEMIIHEQCAAAVDAAGFGHDEIERFEAAILKAGGDINATGVPPEYQQAIEAGWVRGLRLVQRIGANARYFTDSAGKVPIDVSSGNAAAGIAIDFFGRYQAENSRAPDGTERMFYVTPEGGSSASADPISLLRGAPNRELARRFIEFTLREEGQRLWNYAPGTPGGPHHFSLRRLPVRRDFYPSENPDFQAAFERHNRHSVDDLADPGINPYAMAERFTYRPRWTAPLFNVHRDLIRVMCMDAGDELRAAWRSIAAHGGPEANPEAMAALEALPTDPEALTWASAQTILQRHGRLETMRLWTLAYRAQYRQARLLAKGDRP